MSIKGRVAECVHRGCHEQAVRNRFYCLKHLTVARSRIMRSKAPWTKTPPRKEGFYWYRTKQSDKDRIMDVYQGQEDDWIALDVRSALSGVFIKRLHGKWSGPLVPPPP